MAARGVRGGGGGEGAAAAARVDELTAELAAAKEEGRAATERAAALGVRLKAAEGQARAETRALRERLDRTEEERRALKGKELEATPAAAACGGVVAAHGDAPHVPDAHN